MKKIFWLDMEMTGLDVEKNRIIEVAVIVTDLNLEPVERYHAVIRQPESFLEQMDEWNQDTHGSSGLTQEVRFGRLQREVEMDLVALGKRHFPGQRIMLAGNSISQDKLFIDTYMKGLSELLHYRIIDVSSMKAIFQSCYGVRFQQGKNHRAMDDVEESISELKLYLSFLDKEKINTYLSHF